jgi:hypothetical protein
MAYGGRGGGAPPDAKRGPGAGAALSQRDREINNFRSGYTPQRHAAQARGTIATDPPPRHHQAKIQRFHPFHNAAGTMLGLFSRQNCRRGRS